MVRGVIIGIVVTLVVMCGGAYLVLRSGMIPANADATPGALEHFAARTSLRATLNAESPKGPNPVALNDANLLAGMKLYAEHCTVCHGTADGEKSATPIAKGEYPAPPQLATDGVEDDPQGWTFWKIKHGVRWTGMPSWRTTFTDQQIWTLALFLKHMDKLPPDVAAAWRNASAGAAKSGG
jgi:mono/diheme cytochrome c family protein